MNRISILTGALLILFAIGAHGQEKETSTNQSKRFSLRSDGSPAFLEMKEGVVQSSDQFIAAHRDEFGLTENDELISMSSKVDRIGMKVTKYQQYYQGLEVAGAVVVFHEKDRRLTSLNGRMVPDLNLDTSPTLNAAAALQLALNEIEGDLDDRVETPEGVLKISSKRYSFQKDEMRLVYQFNVSTVNPIGYIRAEIDAKTGEIVNLFDQIHHHNLTDHGSVEHSSIVETPATGETLYNGSVNFNADLVNNEYKLRINSKNITTQSSRGSEFLDVGEDIISADAHFDDPEDLEAVSAHWATEASYDYFFDKFGITGYNGGQLIDVHANYGNSEETAFWHPTWGFFYGDGNGSSTTSFAALEIVAHEYAHAITLFSTFLAYQDESGAINESFSDIFGHNVEVYANPTGWSWSNGNEVFTDGVSSVREFSNPKARAQPDTYLGEFWWDLPTDNGGVHTNSGVMNYWYYLLVEGGFGTNDKGFEYNLTGIGLDKAAEIVYRNLTSYITSSSQYVDARLGAEQASIDLYGDASTEHIAVMDAWDAVGVPSQTPRLYTSPSVAFEAYETFTYTMDVPVLNMGQGELNVTNVSIDNSLFTVDKTSFSIGSNGSDILKITYLPTAVQTDMATMTITSDVNTVTVNLTGSGINFPIASTNPSVLNATVETGDSVAQSFNLDNTGLGTLNWQATANAPLILDVTEGSISAGNSATITTTADATGLIAGDYTYGVELTTDDSVSQQFTVPYSVTVTGSPEIVVSSTLELGTVYSKFSFIKNLQIENTGWDTLKISSIEFSTQDMEIPEYAQLYLSAQSSGKLPIVFNDLALGSFSETMTLNGNFPSTTIDISGTVIDNPLTVSLDTIRISMNSVEETTASFDISNALQTSLEIDIIPSDTFRTSTMNYNPLRVVTQAVMLRAWDTSAESDTWDDINANYNDVNIDYTSLHITDFTYEDLQNSGADVLIIPNTFFFFEYTETELNAIVRYIEEGHGLVMYYGTLGFYPSHDRLAQLVGLSKNVTYQATQNYNGFNNPVREHELYEGLTAPFFTNTSTVLPSVPWSDANLEGEVIGKSADDRAIVVRNFNRIYFSDWRYNGASRFDNQIFMRNAIRLANKSFGLVSSDLATANLDATGNQTVNLTISSNGLTSGEHLYYVNLYDASNDLPIGSVPVEVDVTGIPDMAAASNSITFNDTEIGKTDQQGLLIENNGGADLIINDLIFESSNFVPDFDLPFVVKPYDRENLVLNFVPAAAGSLTETVTLQTNDPANQSLIVNLNATGFEVPHLVLGTDTIRITIKENESINRSISLQNHGSVDLEWTASTSFGQVVEEIYLPDFFIDNWQGVTYLNGKLYVVHSNEKSFYTVDPLTKQIDHVGVIPNPFGRAVGRLSTDGTNIYVAEGGYGLRVYTPNITDAGGFAYPENNFVPAGIRGGDRWWSGPDWQLTTNELYEFDFSGNKLATYSPTGTTHVYAMDWFDNDHLIIIDKDGDNYSLKELPFDGSLFSASPFEFSMPGVVYDLELVPPYLWAINPDRVLYQIHYSDNIQINNISGTIASGGMGSMDYTVDVSELAPGEYPFHMNLVSNDPNAPTRIPMVVTVVEDTGGNLPPRMSFSDVSILEDETLTIDFSESIEHDGQALGLSHPVISAQSDEVPNISTSDLTIDGFGPQFITPAPNVNGVFEVEVTADDLEGGVSTAVFKVNVLPVNNAPSFTVGADQMAPDNRELIIISGFCSSISDNDHDSQNLEFIVTNDNPSLFATQPRIMADGTLLITPIEDVFGQATVSVKLRDDGGAEFGGQFESGVQTFTITVFDGPEPPVITAYSGATTLAEDGTLTFSLTDFTVTDPDSTFPDDFTLTVQSGDNYSANGSTLTPDQDFNGTLSVDVVVNDGIVNSDPFNISIDVTPVNDQPVVASYDGASSIDEDHSITLALTDFMVTDPDNTFPDDFSLALQSGNDYTVDGLAITPDQDFSGMLSIPVILNDGTDVSDPFTVSLTVNSVNDVPIITAYTGLTEIRSNETLSPMLSDFTLSDPDNTYPDDFTLTIQAGTNYSVAANVVTPDAGFTGMLSVAAIVNDGTDDSAPFQFDVDVMPVLGIDENEFRIYPNPATTQLTLRIGSVNESVELVFFDEAGKELKRTTWKNTQSNEITLQVTDLPRGLVFIEAIMTGRTLKSKIVLE